MYKKVINAYESGVITLDINPRSGNGTVAVIDDEWFCFGGDSAHELYPQAYVEIVPEEEICEEIAEAIENMRFSEPKKYEYCTIRIAECQPWHIAPHKTAELFQRLSDECIRSLKEDDVPFTDAGVQALINSRIRHNGGVDYIFGADPDDDDLFVGSRPEEFVCNLCDELSGYAAQQLGYGDGFCGFELANSDKVEDNLCAIVYDWAAELSSRNA